MNNTEQPEPPQSTDDLPPPNTKRWVVRRKAAVLAAVRDGRITMQEAVIDHSRDTEGPASIQGPRARPSVSSVARALFATETLSLQW